MHVRVIYDELGIKKGYTTFVNSKEVLKQRLNELGISIESIKVLKIEGEEYSPKKLRG